MTLSANFLIAVFALLILSVIGLVLDLPVMFGSKNYAKVSSPYIGLIFSGIAVFVTCFVIAMVLHGFDY